MLQEAGRLLGRLAATSDGSESGAEERSVNGVYFWGGGHGSGLPSLHNLAVLATRQVRLLACSSHVLCVTQEDGPRGRVDSLWSWGVNDEGQCGVSGDVSDGASFFAKPQLVSQGAAIGAVAVGLTFSAVLRESGSLLFAGTLGMKSRPLRAFSPVTVFQGHICALAAGDLHVAVVVKGGDGRQLVTWGSNTHGQLGHGAVGAESASPELLPFAWPSPPLTVACGPRHTVALLENGALYAWGKNVHVTVSDTVDPQAKPPILGTRVRGEHLPTPTRVQAPRVSNPQRALLACSASYTALVADRRVYTWGECNYSGLGHGAGVTYVAEPTHSPLFPADVVDISCGLRHMLLLDRAGTVYALGYGRHGSLGLGGTADVVKPTVVRHANGAPLRACRIAAGQTFSFAVADLVPLPSLAGMFSATSALQLADFFPSRLPSSASSSSSSVSAASPRSAMTASSSSSSSSIASGELPFIVQQTIDYLESDPECLSFEGIYRVEGLADDKKVAELLWQSGEPLVDFPEHYRQVPTLTFALKSFFRALPPLIPYALFDQFLDAQRLDAAERVRSYGSWLRSALPADNWVCLRRIYLHGLVVMSNEPRNRMGLEAVARMWGNITLRNPDQSPAGLVRQSEVGEVSKVLLQYGHVLFNDFLWQLFLCLLPTTGSAAALEICQLIAKDPCLPAEEDAWLALLSRPPQPPSFTRPLVTQMRSDLLAQLATVRSFPESTPAEVADKIGFFFSFVSQLDDFLFGEHNGTTIAVFVQILRAQRSKLWSPPVNPCQRSFAHTRSIPHPILKLNFSFIGEDEFTECLRQLQQFIVSESILEKTIRTAEQQLQRLWEQDINPALTLYQQLSFHRHARLEHLLLSSVPGQLRALGVFDELADLSRTAASALRDVIRLQALLVQQQHDPVQLRSFITKTQLMCSIRRTDTMFELLDELDKVREAAGIKLNQWRPTKAELAKQHQINDNLIDAVPPPEPAPLPPVPARPKPQPPLPPRRI